MGSDSAAVSTITQNWREHPPSSYSLKVQSFSQLENSTLNLDRNYKSRLFSSGGYNWRLVLYPKGNVKDNGSGFISMYVEIDSTSLMEATPLTEVFAELRFYLYNKKRNKYFTIQDVEVKRFNALKMVWGLLQVLPYDTFIDPENGYLFEGGECEFGVDVIVSPPLTNWEILSFKENLPNSKFSWMVKNFSELDIYRSDIYSMVGRKWFLELHPKGRARSDVKWLSLFLKLADSETLKPEEKISLQGYVRVLDPFGSSHWDGKMNCWYSRSSETWGCYKFLSLAELRKAYLDKEDALTIEVEFQVISATKYSPIV